MFDTSVGPITVGITGEQTLKLWDLHAGGYWVVLSRTLWRQGHKIRQRKKLKCNTVAIEAVTNSPGSSRGWPFSIDLN